MSTLKKSAGVRCSLLVVSFDAGNGVAYTLVINTGINLLQKNELCVNDILTNQHLYKGPV
jgi:hypothetical protein